MRGKLYVMKQGGNNLDHYSFRTLFLPKLRHHFLNRISERGHLNHSTRNTLFLHFANYWFVITLHKIQNFQQCKFCAFKQTNHTTSN